MIQTLRTNEFNKRLARLPDAEEKQLLTEKEEKKETSSMLSTL